MLHPFDNSITDFSMENSPRPQTDMEWIIKLSSNINELTKAVTELKDELRIVVNDEIKVLKEEVNLLKQWKSEWGGSGKLLTILGTVVAIGVGIIAIMIYIKTGK